MPKKDITLEELVAIQQDVHTKNVSRNADNISRIEERITKAVGQEKKRLEAILVLHQQHTAELENVDPVSVATDKFNKLQEKV